MVRSVTTNTTTNTTTRTLRFMSFFILLIVPIMMLITPSSTDSAMGQRPVPRVLITNVIDGNGADLCPPPTGPGPVPRCDPATVSKKITISFEARDDIPNVGFQCSLDGKAFASCSSPITFNNLALGIHTFSVKDTSGDPTQTPTSFQWTVLSSDQGIQKLKSIVNSLQDVSTSTKASLNTRLDGALRYLTDSSTSNDRGACIHLDGFIRTANSFARAGDITRQEVNQMIRTLPYSAQAIKASVGCA
jgi:hypothetical protein